MALRILLADESATIKKVIELSLQDYSVELRIVNLGIDVLEVAKSFKPDLILADILLQKKNGYEVCHDIKSDEETKHIPVVILWSGFMELDQAKLGVVGADDTLEKPFDSEILRDLVKKHTKEGSEQENPLAEHLDVPDIAAPSDFTQVRNLDDINARLEGEPASTDKAQDWDMDSFDGLPDLDFPDNLLNEEDSGDDDEEEDDFSHFELKPPSMSSTEKPDTLLDSPDEESDNEWVNQSLGKFQLDLPEEDDQLEELNGIEIAEIEDPIEDTSFLWNKDIADEIENNKISHAADKEPKPVAEKQVEDAPKISEEVFQESSSDFSDLPPIGQKHPNQSPHPTEAEIRVADEVELSSNDDDNNEVEIEHNHEAGVELLNEKGEVETFPTDKAPTSLTYSKQEIIDGFLESQDFEDLLEKRLNQKLEEMAERMIPELAKQSIEKEIQRLLDEPYKE